MLNHVVPSLRLPNFSPVAAVWPQDADPVWAPDRYLWSYRFEDGRPIAPLMSMLRNGGISNADLPDERSWSFDRDALRLHRQNGTISAVFGQLRQEGGRMILNGLRRDADGGTAGVQLTSRMAYGSTPAGERTLCAESTIRCPSRTLLVVFNSGGSVFDGTRPPCFDFYHLAESLQVDTLRFAEHEGSFARYLDKTALVLRHIESVLTFGYCKVVLLGLSAAGYICVHMANELMLRHPTLSVSSVVANAQLMLDDESESHLIEQVPGVMLSPIWTGSLDHVDFHYRNIDESLRHHGQTGARHVVIYDSGNPGEALHSSHLTGLPGVEVLGLDLGLAHASGIHEMCVRGIIVDAIRRMMEA